MNAKLLKFGLKLTNNVIHLKHNDNFIKFNSSHQITTMDKIQKQMKNSVFEYI